MRVSESLLSCSMAYRANRKWGGSLKTICVGLFLHAAGFTMKLRTIAHDSRDFVHPEQLFSIPLRMLCTSVLGVFGVAPPRRFPCFLSG